MPCIVLVQGSGAGLTEIIFCNIILMIVEYFNNMSEGAPVNEPRIFPTIVNNPVGLMELIRAIADPTSFVNIDKYLTPERFNFESGVRKVNLELAVAFEWEMKTQAARRLISEGYTLENTGELVQFLLDNPSEVAKYSYIVALGELSRWIHPDGRIFVPAVNMSGINRFFYLEVFQTLFDFRDKFIDSNCRVLVSCANK